MQVMTSIYFLKCREFSMRKTVERRFPKLSLFFQNHCYDNTCDIATSFYLIPYRKKYYILYPCMNETFWNRLKLFSIYKIVF